MTGETFPLPRSSYSPVARYSEHNFVTEYITESPLRAILKYKDNPSIFATQSQCEAKTFRLTEVNA